MSFRRILVGWDGSRDARCALRTAMDLAEGLDAEVVVVSVLERPVHAEGVRELARELAARRAEALADIETEARNLATPGRVRLRAETVEATRVATALGEHATRHGFDLLVLGRHGRDRAVHAQVGGVTEHQVRRCDCPVLVVGGG